MLVANTGPQAAAVSTAAPIQVAHVAYSLRTGGLEKLLVEFARHADRQRFQLQFFCMGPDGALAEEVRRLGWPVQAFDKREGFRPRAALQLARELRERGISVVHSHNSGAMIYGVIGARLAKVPAVVHTRHGQRFGSGWRQTKTFACVSQFADRIVGVSDDTTRLCVAEGLPADRIRTIRNGIDIERFPMTGPQSDGPAVIVARLVPEKDLTTLIRAASQVAEEHPKFRLQIVGYGPELPRIEQMVRELRLEWCIELTGERHDVPAILQQASMFVLSSVSEGISLTLLEAMASGLPVVATRVGGNPEVVADGRTGLLVPPGDPQVLAQAILSLIQDPQRAIHMGRQGRERVEQQFEIRRMVRAYEQLYDEVLDGRASRGSRKAGQRQAPAANAASPNLNP